MSIKDYKSEINNKTNNEYIFAYFIIETQNFDKYLKYVKKLLNIDIFYLNIKQNNQVKEFLHGIINSKAVITDSYHATVFSIIFKKAFISFVNTDNDHSRFNSLNEIFNINNRIFEYNETPPVFLLKKSLNINNKKLIKLKRDSIQYLKKNLNNKI